MTVSTYRLPFPKISPSFPFFLSLSFTYTTVKLVSNELNELLCINPLHSQNIYPIFSKFLKNTLTHVFTSYCNFLIFPTNPSSFLCVLNSTLIMVFLSPLRWISIHKVIFSVNVI